MTDRYADIRDREDLGGIEMFPDCTDDLVGAKEKAPGRLPPVPRPVTPAHPDEK